MNHVLYCHDSVWGAGAVLDCFHGPAAAAAGLLKLKQALPGRIVQYATIENAVNRAPLSGDTVNANGWFWSDVYRVFDENTNAPLYLFRVKPFETCFCGYSLKQCGGYAKSPAGLSLLKWYSSIKSN